jgi:hypothetical protein
MDTVEGVVRHALAYSGYDHKAPRLNQWDSAVGIARSYVEAARLDQLRCVDLPQSTLRQRQALYTAAYVELLLRRIKWVAEHVAPMLGMPAELLVVAAMDDRRRKHM